MIEFDLSDPAENGLGLTDPLLLRFDESTPASDATGHYQDAAAPSGSGWSAPSFVRETPPLARTLSGCGREFGATSGYELAPVSSSSQAGTAGSIGVAAVVWIDWAAQWASGQPAVIAGQGAVGSRSWELRIEVIDPSLRLAALRLVWTSSGAEVAVDSGEFLAPVEPFVVIASREAVGTGWVVRYHAAGAALGEVEVTGAVDLTTTASVYVGARSNHTGHLVGVIDQVHVVHRPVTAEEAELVDYRLREAGAEVYTARRAIASATLAWSTDLSSAVQRELQVEAAVLALAKVGARRLARYTHPARCWGGWLRYWEQLVQVSARPGDGIAARRARVLVALRGRLGCSAEDLAALLAESLGYSDPALAEVFAGSVEYTDAFDPLVTSSGVWSSGHVDQAWLAYDGGHVTITQPTGGNDYLQIAMGAVSRDLRYSGWLGQGLAGNANPPSYLRFVGSGAGRNVNALGPGATAGGKWVRVRGELRAAPDFPAGFVVGVQIGSLVDDEWLWVGVRWSGSGHDLVYCRYLAGVLDTNLQVVAAGIGTLPRVIEVTHVGDGRNNVGSYQIRQASSVAGLAAASLVTITGPTRPDWAGWGLTSPASVSSVTGPLTARFADWWQRAPAAGGPLHLRVFRDPADPGIYDLGEASTILQARLLAHLDGTVIDAERGLSLDTTTTLLDRDPLQH